MPTRQSVETVFPDTKILVCHFHFLRDIGKDLLSDNYDIIRKRLKYFGILTELRKLSVKLTELYDERNDINNFYDTGIGGKQIDIDNHSQSALLLYTLIQWILDWKSESKGYGFPFDQPHYVLTVRIEKALDILKINEEITDIELDSKRIISKVYWALMKNFEKITGDKKLRTAAENIKTDIEIFNSLRTAMRIAGSSADDKEGLNDEGEQDIRMIETSVVEFMEKIKDNSEFCSSKRGCSFLEQINKYWAKLFADPIKIETDSGTKTILPQRTNNIMEQMFRDYTRGEKRKTGDSSVGRTVNAIPKDIPLIRNLKNKNYMKIILKNKESLTELFAEVDQELVRKRLKQYKVSLDKIPGKIKLLLKNKALTNILTNITKTQNKPDIYK